MNASVLKMIDLTEEQWDKLFDAADETVQKAIADLPELVRVKAKEWTCWLEKYSPRTDAKILGICFMGGCAIAIYVGQIYEDCHLDLDGAMSSVRQVYYHELAHGIGNLVEWEVKTRGL